MQVYLNEKQCRFLTAPQIEKGFCGGRGAGKTRTIGYHLYLLVTQLPRSKGFILGLTYNQILTKFAPPILQVLEQLGFCEHVSEKTPGHFVIGKQPPSYWIKPYDSPKSYSNIISFCNGCCVELISFDRKDLNRGGSYDWGIVDEAQLLPKDRWDREIRPSVRGNIYRYNSPLHHSIIYTGSMPWKATGFWFPDMKIEAQKRPQDVFYLQATAWDNIHVLGKPYLDRLKQSLPLLVYQVEVMNQRLSQLPNCFYDSFKIERHCYSDSYNYYDDDEGTNITDSDYNPKQPLEISMDFNAAFTSMVVGQEHTKDRAFKFIRCFYEKPKAAIVDGSGELVDSRSIIERCIDQFISFYKETHKSSVKVWGDRNGNNRQANSEYTFYEQIERQLKKHGFNVQLMVGRRLDPLHRLKHFTINLLLAEGNPRLPKLRINENTCKELIMSIQASPVTSDFKKDKSSEQLDIPQERATHLSDCFDNLIYPKYAQMVEASDEVYKADFF